MLATKIEVTVQNDGELHLTHLPCRKGDRVEAIILVLNGDGTDPNDAEKKRQEALQRFNARADASTFRSTGPYPTRDELHERH
jgi:hypothetical protein